MAGWPFPFIAWYFTSNGTFEMPNKTWRLKAFFFLAFLDAGNTALGSVGLAGMSAAAYQIIRGACLIFTMGLSLMLTKKKFNIWHYVGVGLMFLAVVITAVTEDNKGSDSKATLSQTIVNTTCTIFSSLFVSLLSVMTQKLFTDENSKGSFNFVCQIQSWQSLFSFMMTLPMLLIVGEWRDWGAAVDSISEQGNMTLFVFLSLGMFISRPLMLFSNIACTSLSSATYVRALGGPKKLFIIIASYLLFSQRPPTPTLIATVFMTISLGIYVYGGVKLQREKRAAGINPAEVTVVTAGGVVEDTTQTTTMKA